MITQEQRDELLTLIVGTFGAAPTADIMQQLEDGLDQGATLEQYAQSFINSEEFASLYESPEAFARQLLGDSISDEALAEASSFLMNSIANGANVGDLLLTSINAIKNVPADDPVWSGATKQLTNKKAVAEIFIERTATQTPTTGNDDEGNSDSTDEEPAVMDFTAMRSVLKSVTQDESTVAVVREVINSGSQQLFNPEIEIMDIVKELGLEVPELIVEPEEEVEEELEVVISPTPQTPQPAEPTIHELIADYVEFSETTALEIIKVAAEADLQNDLDGEATLDPETQPKEYEAALDAYSFDEFDAELELIEQTYFNYLDADFELTRARESAYGRVNLEGYETHVNGDDESIAKFFVDAQTNVDNSTSLYSPEGIGLLAVYQDGEGYTTEDNDSDVVGYVPEAITLINGYVSALTDFSEAWYLPGSADDDVTSAEGDEGVDSAYSDGWRFTLSEDLNGTLSVGGVAFEVTNGVVSNRITHETGDLDFNTDGIAGVAGFSYSSTLGRYSIVGEMVSEGDAKTPVDLSELEITFTTAPTLENLLLEEDTVVVAELQSAYLDSVNSFKSDVTNYGSNRELIDDLLSAIGEENTEYVIGNFSLLGALDVSYIQDELDWIDSIGADDIVERYTDYLLYEINQYADTDTLTHASDVLAVLSLINDRQALIDSIEENKIILESTEEGAIYLSAEFLSTQRERFLEEYSTAEAAYADDKAYIDDFLIWSSEFYYASMDLKYDYGYKDVIYLNVDTAVDLEENDEFALDGPADLLVYSPDQALSVINNFAMEDDLYLGTQTIFHVVTSESIAADESFEASKEGLSSAELVLEWIQHSAEGFSSSQVDAFAFSDNGTGYIWVEQAANSVSSTVTEDEFNQITFTGVEADTMIMTDGFVHLA